MKTIKVSDAIGPALDWLVAKTRETELEQQLADLLADDFSESKDWRDSNAVGRIEWLMDMVKSLREERDLMSEQLTEAQADNQLLLQLITDIRFACGDNGKRMQDELVEYICGLSKSVSNAQAETDLLKDSHFSKLSHEAEKRMKLHEQLAEALEWKQAVVAQCMQVESCLDKDPEVTLTNLRNRWFDDGAEHQQCVLETEQIVKLRDELAEAQAEIERLKDFNRRSALIRYEQTMEKLAAQQAANAALELEVMRLREAMSDIPLGYALDDSFECVRKCKELLDNPAPETALRDFATRIERATIERVSERVEAQHTWVGSAAMSRLIRALPVGEINLEELTK